MKRARANSTLPAQQQKQQQAEYEALEAEYKALQTFATAFGEKLCNHPVAVARRKEEARVKLAAQVPVALQHLWINKLGLTGLEMLEYADFDGDRAFKMWSFKARLERPTPSPSASGKGRKVVGSVSKQPAAERYEVTLTYDEFTQEWSWDECDLYPVDFDADPERMWEAALRANDDDVGAAMAAFCHECGEHMGDLSAPPSKVKEFAK